MERNGKKRRSDRVAGNFHRVKVTVPGCRVHSDRWKLLFLGLQQSGFLRPSEGPNFTPKKKSGGALLYLKLLCNDEFRWMKCLDRPGPWISFARSPSVPTQSGRPKASVVVLALGTKLANGALGFGILAAESRVEAHECRASRSVRGQRDPGFVPRVRELHRVGGEREREGGGGGGGGGGVRRSFWGDGLGPGKAVYRRDLMGNHGGEATRSLPSVRRSGGDCRHERPRHGQRARLWLRRVCRSRRGRSGGDGEAYHRRQNGKDA